MKLNQCRNVAEATFVRGPGIRLRRGLLNTEDTQQVREPCLWRAALCSNSRGKGCLWLANSAATCSKPRSKRRRAEAQLWKLPSRAFCPLAATKAAGASLVFDASQQQLPCCVAASHGAASVFCRFELQQGSERVEDQFFASGRSLWTAASPRRRRQEEAPGKFSRETDLESAVLTD